MSTRRSLQRYIEILEDLIGKCSEPGLDGRPLDSTA